MLNRITILKRNSVRKLCKLVLRPICSWDRCISDSLDKPEGLQISPFFNDVSLSGKDPNGSGDNCPDHTSVACTSVVPIPSRDVMQTANSAAPSEQSVAFPQPAATPYSSAGPPVISGLDGYRQNLLADGTSPNFRTSPLPLLANMHDRCLQQRLEKVE